MHLKRVLIPLLFTLATPALAQQKPKSSTEVVLKEEQPGLKTKARVPFEKARATALARVPDGQVRSAELEEEMSRLVYSFDIAVKGKPGIEEVQVDALSGEIVSVEHEDEKTEAREKQQEHEEKKPAR